MGWKTILIKGLELAPGAPMSPVCRGETGALIWSRQSP
jgi:hypothetical protein